MKNEETPTENEDTGSSHPSGHSGHGADSAMKQLHEWEERRSRPVLPEQDDKPSTS